MLQPPCDGAAGCSGLYLRGLKPLTILLTFLNFTLLIYVLSTLTYILFTYSLWAPTWRTGGRTLGWEPFHLYGIRLLR